MERSEALLARAQRVIPGGVNSPVRAFRAVGGHPPFIARGEGSWIVDVDGRRFLDLVQSWGALLAGHAPPEVVAAAEGALRAGSSFGAPTEAEVRLAEALVARLPGLDKVRLCSSGTEATLHAVRLARGATGRDRLLKMDGCYHGAHDAVLVAAGSGVATFGLPGSPGVPEATASATTVVPFNDLDAVRAALEADPGAYAAILVEPVAGNMGCVPPAPGYLEGLRALATASGTLLIFDEVMTGFRVGPGGAQVRYGVRPDLTCLGKVVGGGFPLAAFGGRADLMDQLAPVGPVYQGGTLSGNPVAVAAGLATLALADDDAYAAIEAAGARIEAELADDVAAAGASMTRVGGMLTVFFRPTPPRDFAEARTCDTAAFARFHAGALAAGVYLPPSQFEACFLSCRLGADEVDAAVRGMRAGLQASKG
ncbi:MAG: glutamate-1-semialdehyde 2,1-aminomutase [Alphaproteobacteria bacterium]|nr:glutamate-1-semialdehyde 2,1-aminomutase [Alphaproteobacteria bacterium]